MRKKKLVYLIAATCWLALTAFLLTIPGNDLPKEDFLDKIGFDKLVHILLFAPLVISWGLALASPASRKKTLAILTIVWILYGIAMEFVQRYLVVNRSFDIGDIFADAAGCIVGYWLGMRYIKK